MTVCGLTPLLVHSTVAPSVTVTFAGTKPVSEMSIRVVTTGTVVGTGVAVLPGGPGGAGGVPVPPGPQGLLAFWMVTTLT